MTRDPQPYCDDCLVPLTVRQLLVECPSLIDLRHRYLYRCHDGDSVGRSESSSLRVFSLPPTANSLQRH
ncbi:hypothetical protein E2C01_075945 [Portunus trituberculatus]|uniref:Uncharacterized protein n=1 Tax=Portunus trituberculatus TaxID=210409 RepID=A0A5B7IGD1_PORTR|nr:hypothetical protein [Portunus trituberculatus]